MRKQLMIVALVVLAALMMVQVAAAQTDIRREPFSLTGVVSEVGASYFVVDGQTINVITARSSGLRLQTGQTVYVEGFIGVGGDYFATLWRILDIKAFDQPVIDSPVLFTR